MSGCGMAPRKIICISPCQRFSALPPLVHPFNFEKMLCENYKYEKRYRSRCPKKKEQRYSRRWPNTHTNTHKHTFTGKHTVHFSSMLSSAPANFTAFIPDISRIEKNIAPTQHAFAKFIPMSGMGGKNGTQNKKYVKNAPEPTEENCNAMAIFYWEASTLYGLSGRLEQFSFGLVPKICALRDYSFRVWGGWAASNRVFIYTPFVIFAQHQLFKARPKYIFIFGNVSHHVMLYAFVL